jgi:hypothetical protein
MPFSHGTVRTALTGKLGFAPSHTDHEIFELVVNGQIVAATKISHQPRGKDIGEKLLGMMARQCHVSGKVFRGAVSCAVSREVFVSECLGTLEGS